MKKIIRYYFYFSKSERIGLLVLLSLLVAFSLAPRLYAFFKTNPPADFSSFDQAVILLESSAESIKNNTTTETDKTAREAVLFSFDPNTISKDSLALLGLSQKLIKTISNYRNKGGRFYQKEDLNKIYGITKEQYHQLRPFINIRAFGKQGALPAGIKKEKKKLPVVLSPFDANSADEEALERLGLSQKVIHTISNYRNKGGRFYKKDDLQKIYSLPEEQYRQLEPYITIVKEAFGHNKEFANSNDTLQQKIKKKTIIRKINRIDINKASAEEWQSLPGIGPGYAKRITKRRDELGGFISIAQIGEVYGLPDSTFQLIQPFLDKSPLPGSIPINRCDAATLAAHPYLKYRQAKAIISYRKQHGPFSKVEDLKKVLAINEDIFNQISPYLSID